MQANDIRMAAIPIAEIPPHFFWSSSIAMMICKCQEQINYRTGAENVLPDIEMGQ